MNIERKLHTKNRLLAFFFWIFFSFVLKADQLLLLEIPLDNDRYSTYSVNQTNQCSFLGINEIISSDLKNDHNQKKIIEKINLLQRQLNYKVIDPKFSSDSISFSLSNSPNIIFQFELINCEVSKKIIMNGKVYPFDEVEIDYSHILNSPILKKVKIVSIDSYPNFILYPWALHGQISTYELSVGMALKFHSNIRVNNLNNFQKNDPILEPIPAFFFRYGPLFLSKDGLGSLIYHKGNFSIIAMGILEGEPNKALGLINRTQELYLGTLIKYNDFQFTYYNDFFNEKGYNLKLQFVPEFYSSMDWKLNPQIFIQYWDNSYVDYYFGVKSKEVLNSKMNSYQGVHTTNVGAVMEGIHYVGNWSYVIVTGYKHFGSAVYLSPTVNKTAELNLTTAIVYKFF